MAVSGRRIRRIRPDRSELSQAAVVEEVKNHPKHVCASLKRLHQWNESAFTTILQELIDVLDYEDRRSVLWWRYLNAGFYNVLVDIAMDASVYARNTRQGMDYVWDIYDALTMCAECISSLAKDEDLASAMEIIARDFIKITNMLWEFLWARYAAALRRPEVLAVVTEPDLCEEIAMLAFSAFSLRNTYSIPFRSDDLLMQVLLYNWTNTLRSVYDGHIIIAVSVVWPFFRAKYTQAGPSRSAAYPPEWTRIINDLATRKVTLCIIFKRISAALVARPTINEPLFNLAAWFHTITIGYPTFFQISKTFKENDVVVGKEKRIESAISLVRALVRSCQRQVCRGDAVHETRLYACCIGAMMRIWEYDKGESLCTIFVSSGQVIKFMELLAHSLFICVTDVTCNFSGPVIDMLQVIQQVAPIARNIPALQRSPALVQFLLSAKRLHRPILDELRTMPSRTLSTADFESFRKKAIEAWKGTCTKLESLVADVPDFYAGDDSDYLNLPKRCYNLTCFCYDPDPEYECHHTMRACKGCWRAFYCNTRCQKKDWSRHRVFCQRKEARWEGCHTQLTRPSLSCCVDTRDIGPVKQK